METMLAAVADTPYYVLLDNNRRIGPSVAPLEAGRECMAIYAFSNKRTYDIFCTSSQLALTPYPLVQAYLRSQVDEPNVGLKLVVLDAAGPLDPSVHAASMEAVLEAQVQRTPQVTPDYHLVFDPEADAYRVEDQPG